MDKCAYFKDIPGYEGFYKINTAGKIFSVPRMCHKNKGQKRGGKFLSPWKNYNQVYINLYKNSRYKRYTVQELIDLTHGKKEA